MKRKLSSVVAVVVIVSALFTAVAYACSGLRSMQMVLQASRHDSSSGAGPCGQQQQDICDYVRYRMLSIQASSPQTDIDLGSSTLANITFPEVSKLPDILSGHAGLHDAFYPGFEISPHFLHVVLRI
jgi:hypothetical protein